MIEPGVYLHFKGGRYLVIGECVLDSTRERMVLYTPLYGNAELTVRPLAEFIEVIRVEGEKGQLYWGPRFRSQSSAMAVYEEQAARILPEELRS